MSSGSVMREEKCCQPRPTDRPTDSTSAARANKKPRSFNQTRGRNIRCCSSAVVESVRSRSTSELIYRPTQRLDNVMPNARCPHDVKTENLHPTLPSVTSASARRAVVASSVPSLLSVRGKKPGWLACGETIHKVLWG